MVNPPIPTIDAGIEFEQFISGDPDVTLQVETVISAPSPAGEKPGYA
jgi:hypothetical protein